MTNQPLNRAEELGGFVQILDDGLDTLYPYLYAYLGNNEKQATTVVSAIRGLTTDFPLEGLDTDGVNALLKSFGDVSRVVSTYKGIFGMMLRSTELEMDKALARIRPGIAMGIYEKTKYKPTINDIKDGVNVDPNIQALDEKINQLNHIYTILSESVETAKRRESVLTQLSKNVRED